MKAWADPVQTESRVQLFFISLQGKNAIISFHFSPSDLLPHPSANKLWWPQFLKLFRNKHTFILPFLDKYLISVTMLSCHPEINISASPLLVCIPKKLVCVPVGLGPSPWTCFHQENP